MKITITMETQSRVGSALMAFGILKIPMQGFTLEHLRNLLDALQRNHRDIERKARTLLQGNEKWTFGEAGYSHVTLRAPSMMMTIRGVLRKGWTLTIAVASLATAQQELRMLRCACHSETEVLCDGCETTFECLLDDRILAEVSR